jgi:hypothetical protein
MMMMMKNMKYSRWVGNDDDDDEEHESNHDGLVMMMMKNMKVLTMGW